MENDDYGKIYVKMRVVHISFNNWKICYKVSLIPDLTHVLIRIHYFSLLLLYDQTNNEL